MRLVSEDDKQPFQSSPRSGVWWARIHCFVDTWLQIFVLLVFGMFWWFDSQCPAVSTRPPWRCHCPVVWTCSSKTHLERSREQWWETHGFTGVWPVGLLVVDLFKFFLIALIWLDGRRDKKDCRQKYNHPVIRYLVHSHWKHFTSLLASLAQKPENKD